MVQKLSGGGGGAPSHLRLLFCKIVYIDGFQSSIVTTLKLVITN